MRKETEAWWKQAQEDLDDAQFNFKGGRYKTASFLCQQAVEKAFKAFLIEKKEQLRKIHDLVELSREIGIPARLLAGIKELTLAYIYSRYPDVTKELNLKEKAGYFLDVSREALQWVEENL